MAGRSRAVAGATSRAPTNEITGSFDRTLAIAETAHVTFHVSEPAMDHVRSVGGALRLRAQTSAGGIRVLPDASDSILVVADGGATSLPVAGATCPATGACDVGLTLEGPMSGEDTDVRVFLDVTAGTQQDFPVGSAVTAEED